MSIYGIKIKNISAGSLYDYNLGLRDYYMHTDAMLNNSLFSNFLKQNGMKVYKESTRDMVCLDFDFGSRSYEHEKKRLEKIYASSDTETKERILKTINKVDENKHLYSEKKREEIREEFYENGVNICYIKKNKDGSIKEDETIHYTMLYRTSAKAKLGQVIFINSKLYDKAYDWLTIGLGNKMPVENAMIVELSAYAPLTTSTTIDTIHIPVEDILILKDQDSFFKTLVNIVKAEEYIKNVKNNEIKSKKCIVEKQEYNVKNTLWDGMGLIEADILPSYINGMALLRNHFMKMCGFKSNIQLFFKDWCSENGHDYNTHQIKDMFGKYHYLKDIKVITTNNSIKWLKFVNLMGDNLEEAYNYWCNRINSDESLWGIVKTDHKSKLGDLQQMSYQMINTLPCSKNDVKDIAQTSIDYVELLKKNNNEFETYLRNNANEVNHYEMLADMYKQNKSFANSTWFRYEKRQIIRDYVYRLRTGKITLNADNLTICGNPYALLLHSVGEDWKNDPTLKYENETIQCYTTRFLDNEYLCAFRNPHNSPNNICYLHNVYSNEMKKYFLFSDNILALNCIETDIQDRSNGCDFDSDFFFVTNHSTMVKYAKVCYKEFPTIVNTLKESGITYQNTKLAYAQMDNKFSKSRLGIGWSSNLAQLAMTYYWTELYKEKTDTKKLKELHDNFIILSVLAQVIIDGCKREYEIDGMEEINRIQKLDCMHIENSNKVDYPLFMKYTKEIPHTKNKKELPNEVVNKQKNKLAERINYSLICPMNWLQEWLDKIKSSPNTNTTPTKDFFIKIKGRAHDRQMTKICTLIEEYDNYIKHLKTTKKYDDEACKTMIVDKSKELIQTLQKIKIGNIVTINRLIETALGLETGVGASNCKKGNNTKYARKILNYLYKMDKDKFLNNFM